ncbi:hypothetical protein HRI_000461300 [Hibiscus trionum]|uniref:Cyanobacterial aminoacyl-tRNA synthetase CAAD domain-containing protein n=1 Tax=Hibiscus trionum TaxID=183268 RepID=A0A9W7GYM1_HIBTR|nr:hypothetical protein HRI_000461300 [Hibiscus trionum]
MELSSSLARPISATPTIRSFTAYPSFCPHLRPLPPFSPTARRLYSRVSHLNSPLLKATTSTGPKYRCFREDRDSAAALDEVPAVHENVYSEKLPVEDLKQQSADQEEFSEKLNIKPYSITLYGGGALVAVWLASAVVESIPLFPKLMETVGLGYTCWFSSRYLLFKRNREELAAKIEDLKQQLLGFNDELKHYISSGSNLDF